MRERGAGSDKQDAFPISPICLVGVSAARCVFVIRRESRGGRDQERQGKRAGGRGDDVIRATRLTPALMGGSGEIHRTVHGTTKGRAERMTARVGSIIENRTINTRRPRSKGVQHALMSYLL